MRGRRGPVSLFTSVFALGLGAVVCVQDALAHPESSHRAGRALQSSLTVVVTPETATNPVGTEHTVQAHVTDETDSVVAGASVIFTVTGANGPQTFSATTDASGVATFTYTGLVAGDDLISATAVHATAEGGFAAGTSNTATKTWVPSLSVTKTNGATSRTATVTYDWSIAKAITSGPTPGTVGPGGSATVGYRLVPTRTEVSRVETGHVTATVCVTNTGPTPVTGTVTDTVSFNGTPRGTNAQTAVMVPPSNGVPTCTDITVDFAVNNGETTFTNVATFIPDVGTPATSSQQTFTIPATATITSLTDEAASLTDSCTVAVNASCGAPSATFPRTLTGADSGIAIDYTRQIMNTAACRTNPSTPNNASVTNAATLTESDTQQLRVDSRTATLDTPLCLTVTKGIGSETNTLTYHYDVTKVADAPTRQVPIGSAGAVGYTVIVTRTVVSTSATIAGSGAGPTSGICVTNNTGAAGTPNIVDTVSPGGNPQTVVAASVANDATACFAFSVSFTPGSDGTQYNNHVDVALNGSTSSTDTAFTLPEQTATNPTASIADAITTCTPGLSCTPPASPLSYAEEYGSQHTFAVSSTVTNDELCPAQGTVTNTAVITSGNPETQALLLSSRSLAASSASASTTIETRPCLAAGVSISPSRTFVYDWTVTKTTPTAVHTIGQGDAVNISYTITATRTKTGESNRFTGNICIRNRSFSDDAVGVDVAAVLETDADVPVPGQTPFSSTGNTVAKRSTQCLPYAITFTPTGAPSYHVRVTIVSANETLEPVVATSPDAAPASFATATTDAAAFVTDALQTCPPSFACDMTPRVFTFPRPADHPDSPHPSAAPYTGSVTFTRRVANNGQCGSGSVVNLATLTEGESEGEDGVELLRSAEAQLVQPGHQAAATAFVIACNPSPPPPPPAPPVTPPAPPPSADLSLTKAVNRTTVSSGSSITYTETVKNNGPSAATGVKIVDQLPTGVVTTATSTQGTCTGAGTTSVTCTIGTLASGASATVTIVAGVVVAGQYTNTATTRGNELDPNAANNTATAGFSVAALQPRVTKPKKPKKKPRRHGQPRFTGVHHHP